MDEELEAIAAVEDYFDVIANSTSKPKLTEKGGLHYGHIMLHALKDNNLITQVQFKEMWDAMIELSGGF